MCDGRPETQKGVEDRGGAADVEVAEGVEDVDDAEDGRRRCGSCVTDGQKLSTVWKTLKMCKMRNARTARKLCDGRADTLNGVEGTEGAEGAEGAECVGHSERVRGALCVS